MRAHEAGWAHAEGGHRGPAWLREPADVNALVPLLWSSTATKNADGALEIGGVDVRDLVAEQELLEDLVHAGGVTEVGDHCFLMAGSHVGHDCRVGERVTFETLMASFALEQDLALIREIGYCNGIENYSRHFDGRAPGDRSSRQGRGELDHLGAHLRSSVFHPGLCDRYGGQYLGVSDIHVADRYL